MFDIAIEYCEAVKETRTDSALIQFYELAPKSVKIGGNEVTVKAKGKNKRGQTATLGNIAVEVKFPKPGKEAGK